MPCHLTTKCDPFSLNSTSPFVILASLSCLHAKSYKLQCQEIRGAGKVWECCTSCSHKGHDPFLGNQPASQHQSKFIANSSICDSESVILILDHSMRMLRQDSSSSARSKIHPPAEDEQGCSTLLLQVPCQAPSSCL